MNHFGKFSILAAFAFWEDVAMGGRGRREVPPELVRARDRFLSWRRTSKPKSRIPEPLWALAVKLSSAHGLHRTASVLRLDYYSLKKRVEATRGPQDSKGPAFIELSPAVTAGRECVVEFEDGAGVSCRIQLRGYDATDLVVVGRCFRNAE
jgi:hypothetical protein